MTKIVVGALADPADMDVAIKLRNSIPHLWLTPIVRDNEVTDLTEELILVGGWVTNTISKAVNDTITHYTVFPDVNPTEFHDAAGANLGNIIVAKVQNYQLIWGVLPADTLAAADVYIGAEWWKVPVIGGVVVVGAYFLARRRR